MAVYSATKYAVKSWTRRSASSSRVPAYWLSIRCRASLMQACVRHKPWHCYRPRTCGVLCLLNATTTQGKEIGRAFRTPADASRREPTHMDDSGGGIHGYNVTS